MKIRTRISLLYIALSATIIIIFSVFVLALFVKLTYDSEDKELKNLTKEIINIFELDKDKDFIITKETDDLSLIDDRWTMVLSSDKQILYISSYAKINPIVLSDSDFIMTSALKKSKRIHNTKVSLSKPENHDEQSYFRTRIEPVFLNSKIHYYIITAVKYNDYFKEFQLISIADFLGVFLFLGFIGIVGYLFGGRILKPIKTIIVRTNRISTNNLHERIPLENPGDELGQLTDEINNLLSRIEKSFEHQKQFISDVAHELKTPLSVIRIKIENQINSPDLNDDLKESFYYLLESTAFLQTLINKLLLLARLEESANFSKEPILLQHSINQVFENLTSLAESKNILFNNQDGLSNAKVMVDKELIYLALFNIVENAVKFTETGTVSIISKIIQNKAFIEVIDTGIGISIENQEKIFDRFFRIKDSKLTNYPGTGVGLSISKRVIEMFGGIIRVESKNNGSTFIIELPLIPNELKI